MRKLDIKTILVDKKDEHLLSANAWRLCRGYVQRHRPAKGGEIMLHRMILSCPKGFFVDHKNGNKLDNRRENLRLATPSQSVANTAACVDGSSNYKGVTLHRKKGKWQAQIGFRGRSRYLGLHHTQLGAALAYDKAARKIFGEFAKPNFPAGGVE